MMTKQLILAGALFIAQNVRAASSEPAHIGRLTPVPEYPYTPTTNFGEIGWTKFPTFKPPADNTYVYVMPGRNQARTHGHDIFDWGWTTYSKTDDTDGLTRNQRWNNRSGFGPMTDNFIRWHSENGVESFPESQFVFSGAPGSPAEYIVNQDANDAKFLMFDIEFPNPPDSKYNQDVRAATAYYWHQRALRDHVPLRISMYLYEPYVQFGQRRTPPVFPRYANYDGADGTFTDPIVGGGTGFPKELIGKRLLDYVDYFNAAMYPYYENAIGNGTNILEEGPDSGKPYVTKPTDPGVNILVSELEQEEILRKHFPEKITAKGKFPLIHLTWLWIEDFSFQKRYTQTAGINRYTVRLSQPTDNWHFDKTNMVGRGHDGASNISLSDDIAKAMTIFNIMAGCEGIIWWDYAVGDLTVNDFTSGSYKNGTTILPLTPEGGGNKLNPDWITAMLPDPRDNKRFMNDRSYSAVEGINSAFYRMYGGTDKLDLKALFFNNPCTYLNQDTEVDYGDGKGFKKYTALELEPLDLPVVRAVVCPSTKKILIAAYKPYQSPTYKQTVTVKYAAKTYQVKLSGKNVTVCYGSL